MDEKRERVLIVSGSAGSGRTSLLLAATEVLRHLDPPPVVVSGRISSQEDGRAGFVTWDEPPSGPSIQQALAVIQGAVGAGGLVVPTLKFVAAVLGASKAAVDLVGSIRERGKKLDRLSVVSDILRAAVSEGPCVCA